MLIHRGIVKTRMMQILNYGLWVVDCWNVDCVMCDESDVGLKLCYSFVVLVLIEQAGPTLLPSLLLSILLLDTQPASSPSSLLFTAPLHSHSLLSPRISSVS